MTKKELAQLVAEKTEAEKQRVLEIMREADLYTLTLDPLIESYLDIYEAYTIMYLQWKEKGFPATQRHTNKAGATNNSKHPLAQQVETWSDKKIKALAELGLTNKNKSIRDVVGKSKARQDEEMKRPDKVVNELDAHRNKWRKKKNG
jgi:phage terminase small subunit